MTGSVRLVRTSLFNPQRRLLADSLSPGPSQVNCRSATETIHWESMVQTRRKQFAWLFLLFGTGACANGTHFANNGLTTELSTYSAWGLSKYQFCPEEPVNMYARISNIGEQEVPLVLIPGPASRALVRISDTKGRVVWDTDVLDQLEEERAVQANGIGRIVAGPAAYLEVLPAGGSAIWQMRWEQKDIEGDYVAPGRYLIEVFYRWRQTGDDGDWKPIRIEPASIEVSNIGCE